jgi:hypothetical protein
MRGWVAIIGAAALTGLLLGGAAADVQKGARGGSSGSSSAPSGGAPSGSPDESGLIEPLSIAGWTGGAYYDEFNDENYCELSDDYDGGATVWVGWDADGFYVTITDPARFKVEAYQDIKVALRIDDFFKRTVTAYSLDTDTLDFSFGEDRKAIEAFRKGIKLYLDKWDRWYTLYGLGKAIAALEDCYRRHG